MYERIATLLVRHLVLCLCGIFILRISYLFFCGLDLIGDESYYWDWSRQLDWCYYSKPPMVAWLIAASTAVMGDNEVAVRMPAAVLGTLTLYYLFKTAKAFYTPEAGAFALMSMLAMPFNVLANFLMTIDAPLNAFWMMSLYYLRRALFDGRKNAWCVAGVATGAALLSKQVALLIPLALLIYLIIEPTRRTLLKHEFLVYLVPIFLSLAPIFWWNAQHDWVMFGHSKGHFGIRESAGIFVRLQEAAEFSGYQLLLATPVLYGVFLGLTVKKVVNFFHNSPEDQFLLLMGPVMLLGIIALSLLQKVQGNWPMPFYLSGLVLVSGQPFSEAWKKFLKNGVLLGYMMVLLTYLLPAVVKGLHLQNTAFDPTARFKNWSQFAHSVEAVRQRWAPGRQEITLITAGHRFLTSQLAFYLPDHPRVYRYEESGRPMSQYEIWPGPGQLNKPAFIITEQNMNAIPASLTSAFDTFRLVGDFADPANLNKRYYLFFSEKLLRWPIVPQASGDVR